MTIVEKYFPRGIDSKRGHRDSHVRPMWRCQLINNDVVDNNRVRAHLPGPEGDKLSADTCVIVSFTIQPFQMTYIFHE